MKGEDFEKSGAEIGEGPPAMAFHVDKAVSKQTRNPGNDVFRPEPNRAPVTFV